MTLSLTFLTPLIGPVPLQVIAEFVLHRVVDDFFTGTEQAAFCTRYVVDNTFIQS